MGRNLANLESGPSGCFPDSTTLLTSSLGSSSKFMMSMFAYPTPQGALTPLWAGTSPDTADLNGAVSLSSLLHRTRLTAQCSISAHGRGSSNLAATTRSLGESSGFGSKSRLRNSDHLWLWGPPYSTKFVSNLARGLLFVPDKRNGKGNGHTKNGTAVVNEPGHMLQSRRSPRRRLSITLRFSPAKSGPWARDRCISLPQARCYSLEAPKFPSALTDSHTLSGR